MTTSQTVKQTSNPLQNVPKHTKVVSSPLYMYIETQNNNINLFTLTDMRSLHKLMLIILFSQ